MKHGNTVGSRGSLSPKQHAMLVGKILGDGCLEKNGKHVRLRIEHGEKQEKYVFWFYKEFNMYVQKQPYILWHAGRNGKQTKRWRFSTLSLNIFDQYYMDFYHNGKKRIPEHIQALLQSPLVLAVWYMDDGYLRTDKSGAYICSSSFTQKEHEVLQQTLFENFSLHTAVHFAGGFARLHIPSRDLRMFANIIRPHMVECMKYKFPLTP